MSAEKSELRSKILSYLWRPATAVSIATTGAYAVQEAHAAHENINFRVDCTDPAGDEHPRSADILQVRVGENSTHKFFEFTQRGSVSTRHSILGPDEGYGGGFLEKDGTSNVLFLAQGAAKTEDAKVVVVKLKEPKVIKQGPAIPLKIEETLFEGNSEDLIEVSDDGRVLTFHLPKEVISPWLENRVVYFTTEAVGHGSKVTPQNINKDVCEEEVRVTPTLTPAAGVAATPTPTLTPTATSIPQPSPTPTPALIPPKELPPTGSAPESNDQGSNPLIISGAVASAIGAIAFVGEFLRRKNRSR